MTKDHPSDLPLDSPTDRHWPQFDDLSGLTPPRDLEPESSTSYLKDTYLHGTGSIPYLNTTAPPTPPTTEAHSSPTRSTASSPHQYATNTRPSSAEGIAMAHADGDVLMGGASWPRQTTADVNLPFGLIGQSMQPGLDATEGDEFGDLVNWDVENDQAMASPEAYSQPIYGQQMDRAFGADLASTPGSLGVQIKKETHAGHRRKRSRDEEEGEGGMFDHLSPAMSTASMALTSIPRAIPDRGQKLMMLEHGCIAAGTSGGFVPEYLLEVEWPARQKIEGYGDAVVKSRVETQIQIQFLVSSFTGHQVLKSFHRLRLPRDTISKVKYLDDSPAREDMLDLEVKLVCASLLHHPGMVERLFYEGRGEPVPGELLKQTSGHLKERLEAVAELMNKEKGAEVAPVPDTSRINSVHICPLCVKREKKRAARKKTVRKQEEEEQWGEAQDRRVISFNTQQIIPLVDAPYGGREALGGETNIRICCYCRHHHEKEGFRVLFNLKNSTTGAITAQTLSGTILITDDHKNSRAERNNDPESARSPQNKASPSAMMSPMASGMSQPSSRRGSQGTEMSYTSAFVSNPGSTSRKHPSQPPTPMRTSPSPGLTSNKRRKPSKVPASLTMTPSDPTLQQQQRQPQQPAPQYMPDLNFGWSQPDLDMDVTQPNPFAFQGTNTALWNMPIQPNPNNYLRHQSPQYDPSTAGLAFNTSPINFNLAAPIPQYTPTPQQTVSITHCVPSEGSCSGGYEATILGRGFVRGMTVMFGDKASPGVSFMSEGTLLCLVPPNPIAGPVVVHFKNRPYSNDEGRIIHFNYKDDVDNELMSLAMKVVGMKMMGPERASSTKEVALRILSDNGAGLADLLNGNHSRTRSPAQFESELLACLDLIDMDPSPWRAKLNQKNRTGQTLLHLACRKGFTKLAAALIARGVNVNSRDRCGYTPLHFAAMGGQNDIIRRLLNNRADPAIRTRLGDTAADLGGESEILRHTRSVQRRSRSSSLNSEGFMGDRRGSSTDLAGLAPLTRCVTADSGTRGQHQRRSVDDMFPPSASSDDGELDSEDEEDEVTTDDSQELSSTDDDASPPPRPRSRRDSLVPPIPPPITVVVPTAPTTDAAIPPPQQAQQVAQAWFDELRTQFLASLQNLHLPAIPQMPTMPTIPTAALATEYQAILRDRMVAGLPNLPNLPNLQSLPNPFTVAGNMWHGDSAVPPAYEEIFPDGSDRPEIPPDTKDTSPTRPVAGMVGMMRGLSVSNMRQRITRTPSPSPVEEEEEVDVKELQRQLLVKGAGEGEEGERLKEKVRRLQQASGKGGLRRGGKEDARLWFFWLPMFILMCLYMVYSYGPQVWGVVVMLWKVGGRVIREPGNVRDGVWEAVGEWAGRYIVAG